MTVHETIFDAINGVHRDPYLSLSAANAVVDALDAAGYTIESGRTRCVPRLESPRCACGHRISDHSGNYSGSRACDHCACPGYPLT